MNKLKKVLVSVLVAMTVVLFGTSITVNAQETPWVYDETNQITQEYLDAITYLNEDVFPEYDIQPQIGVEILHKLPEGYSGIDEYRVQRFNELGIGNAEHDSGVLFVIAIEDREFAIETGYGVEPIIRDIEANAILDNMKEDMVNYSDTGDPKYLNNAVSEAVGTMASLLEKGNTGELYAQREAEEARRLEKQEERKETFKAIVSFMGIGTAGVITVIGFRTYRKKREEEKLQQLRKEEAEKLIEEFNQLYNKRGVPFEDEYDFEDFKEYLMEDIKGKELKYIMSLGDDKMATLNRYRLEDLDRVVQNTKPKNPIKYYTKYYPEIKDYIGDDTTKLVATYVNDLDKKFEDERQKAYKLQDEIKQDVEEFLENEPKVSYINQQDTYKSLYNALAYNMRLTETGVMNLNVRDASKETRQTVMEDVYQKELVKGYIETQPEFTGNKFGHGTKQEFINHVTKNMDRFNNGNKNLRNKAVLGALLISMLTIFLQDKEREYQLMLQKQEEERRRREEEERRRIERQRMSSSSSSSSSSSGSFGGGFGGGSSGGGGASGGW